MKKAFWSFVVVFSGLLAIVLLIAGAYVYFFVDSIEILYAPASLIGAGVSSALCMYATDRIESINRDERTAQFQKAVLFALHKLITPVEKQ